MGSTRTKHILFLTALLLAVLGVFLRRAFSIDDPLFIWVARHIQSDPWNPYGFKVNWYNSALPISEVAKNPPLISYVLAFAAGFLGWSEPALHFVMILASIAVAIGTYLIAERLCAQPLVATLAGILTPVFLVSSLNVMSDIPMLAFWVFAVYLWMKGLDETNHRALAIAAILAGMSALTKYFGMALMPLLLVYSIYKKRTVGAWLLYLLIPMAMLAWYQWKTEHLYGRGLLLDAAVYTDIGKSELAKFPAAKTYADFVFAGGCIATVLFFAWHLWSRRIVVIGLAFAAALAFIFTNLSTFGFFRFPSSALTHALLCIQLGVWGVAGFSLVALAVSDVQQRQDADSLLLFLWIIGTFIFAGFVNWTLNGRSILPMTIPAGILIARRLEIRKVPSGIAPLMAALLLSFAVAWADTAFADTARSAAATVWGSYGNRRAVWFQGHWGFQYYMQEMGAIPIDVKTSVPFVGDVAVMPSTNSNLFEMGKNWPLLSRFEIPSTPWLSTVNSTIGAGFYSDFSGPLPFAIGAVPPERFTILEIVGK